MFAAFMIWFRAQTPATRRALIKERALAYLDHPAMLDILNACPDDVRSAAENLLATVRRSDWRG